MSSLTPSVADPFRALKRAMDAEEPRVVVVVGAGVSIGATGAAHASWKGLLEHGLGFLRDRGDFGQQRCDVFLGRLSAAFSPFDPELALELAENIQHSLQHPDPDAFAAWLENAFDAFSAQPGRRATLDALLELQRAGALLLTTNYDSLLSDCTGLRPVTRDDKEAFLRVVNRQDEGILHIHGHWREPASVVLGVRSYDDIVDDPLFQDGFKSLWMQNHWLYVGCGNGLEDPNLGRLLAWGKQWGKGPREHYYLSIEKEADALRGHPGTPANLICVGMADFAGIPPVLHDLSPVVRCAPFARIEADCAHVRPAHSSHVDNPFPSWKEYLDGDVPALQADDLVRERLRTHSWAFVLDVASVGKTTLAMRLATAADQRGRPAFHLDLADVGPDEDDDSWAMALMALRRLAKSGTLLIVDNAHHAPALARKLWTQWRESRSGGRLLLIATEAERAVTTDPAQDLGFFRMHPDNPALALRPQPEDLKRILHSILRRFGSHRASASMQDPPAEAVDQWYRDYGHALGAFCIAVLGRRACLQAGDWSLPYAAAAEWVWEKWLRPLNDANRANALCLAAFGAQELEIPVDPAALPHPSKLGQLLNLGLVAKSMRGKHQQFLRYRLREPSWGRLLLASHHAREGDEQDVETFTETLLFEAAARHLPAGALISVRWRRVGVLDRPARMWEFLAEKSDHLRVEFTGSNLIQLSSLLKEAGVLRQKLLQEKVWNALEKSLSALIPLAFATPLADAAHFLSTARQQKRTAICDGLWGAFEADSDRLADSAFATSLEHVAHFLGVARQQGRTVVCDSLWGALEADPNRLADAAFATALQNVANFLGVAWQRGRTVVCDSLWGALEADPNRLADTAFATSLRGLAYFLEIARQHRRTVICDSLWGALEAGSNRLANTAFATSLHDLAYFLEIARQHRRTVICDSLWGALEAGSNRLANTAFETSLHDLAHFLEIARQHGRTTACDHLWDALEKDLGRLARMLRACTMKYARSFLDVIQSHGRDGLMQREIRLDFEVEPSVEPQTLTYRVIERIPVEHWAEIGQRATLQHAVMISMHCRRVGQHQHAQAIRSIVISRAQAGDFPPDLAGFSQAALLLAFERSDPRSFKLIDALCTKPWLHWQYHKAKLGVLASGLRLLALHQPAQVVQRFRNAELRLRLGREFSDFSQLVPTEQHQSVQLLGCSVLCGQTVGDSLLRNVVDKVLAVLPEQELPHRESATHVEEWQYQLWLGLRTVVALKKGSLRLAPGLIRQTRDLWRFNLERSATAPLGAEHRVDQQMVAWLDDCLRRGECDLIPPQRFFLLPELAGPKPG